jgi:hypothetical protein
MSIPSFWRSRFGPRDPLTEERPRNPLPDAPPNIDLPFEQTANRVEGERDALQDAISQLNARRNRWEL